MAKHTGKLKESAPTPVRAPGGGPARAVGSYVPGLTRKAFEKYGFAGAALLTDWVRIVGADIAEKALPDKLKWPRGVEAFGETDAGDVGRPGATLVLRVDPAHALDIEYQGRLLIERINAFFGYRAVAELRLIQCPLQEHAQRRRAEPLQEARPEHPHLAAGVADEPLRSALMRLEAGMRGERHQT